MAKQRIILTNAKIRCTKCVRWKSSNNFGFRKMADGSIRNQPQCTKCRNNR